MPHPLQVIRKMLPYTTAAACVALLYLAWVFYSRASQNRELQRKADEKSLEESRKIVEMYGSGHLKIMLFYAVPPVVGRGETAKLCYSVSNAASVHIDHGVEEIKPSLSRCVEISPTRSTVYTLSAADAQGNQASQTVNVEVR